MSAVLTRVSRRAQSFVSSAAMRMVASTSLTVQSRTYTTIVHPDHGVVQGPFYRYEYEDPTSGRKDNSQAIIESRKLLAGEGYAGKSQGVYALANRTMQEVVEQGLLQSSWVAFFTKTFGRVSEVGFNGPQAFWQGESVDIIPVKRISLNGGEILDPALWRVTLEDAASQGAAFPEPLPSGTEGGN